MFDHVADIKKAKSAMTNAAITYSPVHNEVRAIDRVIRQAEAEIKKLRRDLRSTDQVNKRNKIQNEIAELQNRIVNQRKLIPSDWQSTNREFKKLTTQLNSLRTKLRRQSDETYATIRLLVLSIEDEAKLAAFSARLQKVQSTKIQPQPRIF